ncbi:unnamed protein product, partial [Mesorhabditis spiculigera]
MPSGQARPFLRRGAGTTSKYKIDYPALKNKRDPQVLEDEMKRPEMHYASSPVRQRGTTTIHEEGSLKYNDAPRPMSSQGAGKTDSGRGSREGTTPDENLNPAADHHSPGRLFGTPEYPPFQLPSPRANDSGLSNSVLDTPEANTPLLPKHREMVLDPDDTGTVSPTARKERVVSLNLVEPPVLRPVEDDAKTVASSTSQPVSSLGTNRSERVRDLRKLGKEAGREIRGLQDALDGRTSTLNGVSEITEYDDAGSVPSTIPGPSRISVPTYRAPTEDSNYLQRNFGSGYRPFADLVPLAGQSVRSSIANALPSQATRKPPPLQSRKNQVDSVDFRSLGAPSSSNGDEYANKANQLNSYQLAPQPKTTAASLGRYGDFLAQPKPLQRLAADMMTPEPRAKGRQQPDLRRAQQLCDTITSLDFARAEWDRRRKACEKRFDAEWAELIADRAELDERKKEFEERMQRETSNFEKLKKAQNRGANEKDKERDRQLDDAKQQNAKLFSQKTDIQNRLKKRDAELEAEKAARETERDRATRLQGRVEHLQQEVAQLRGRVATGRAVEDRTVAANARDMPRQQLQMRKSYGSGADSGFGSTQSLGSVAHRRPLSGKNVHWSDHNPIQPTAPPLPTMPSTSFDPENMSYFETTDGRFGKVRTFVSGHWTKETTTPCGCKFYEYHNGDRYWKGCGITVYYFLERGATEVALANGTVMRHYVDEQFEIFRTNGEMTLIRPDGTRTEMKRRQNGTFGTESYALARDPSRSTFNGRRPLNLHVAECDAWIWYDEGNVKINIDSSRLQIQLLAADDAGTIKHIQMNGDRKEKHQCVEWSAKARREARLRAAMI